MAEIGLFPLGLMLLPGERVPLHIFEPRYKELINECINNETEFGIVLLNSQGTRDVGTKAEVVEVLERFEDGRLNIVVEGGDRFKLLEIRAERSYLTAQIGPLLDDSPVPPDSAYEDCLREYRRVMQTTGLELEELVPDHRGLAFQVAAQFRMGVDVKQELLEMRSESERLAPGEGAGEASATAIRRQVIEQRASTNGKVERLGPLGQV